MIGGISYRWKQIIGYHFTGNSTPGELVWQELLQIIIKAESYGLRVHFVTADMGPVNQGFWKVLGITAGRYSKTINSIEHPCDPNRRLWFLADNPHLLKNILNGLENNGIFTLDSYIQEYFSLETNIVQYSHIEKVVNLQEYDEYNGS